MSLLRLLATGKSLVGMKDGNSPYRMCTKNLLPNFGSDRNPFQAAPKPEAAIEPVSTKPAGPENMSLFDSELKPSAQFSAKVVQNAPQESPRGHLGTPVAACVPAPLSDVAVADRPGENHGLIEFGSVETAVWPARVKTVVPLTEAVQPVPKFTAVAPVEEKPVVQSSPVTATPKVRKVETTVPAQEVPARPRPARKPVKASGFSRWLASMNPMQITGWGAVGAKRPARSRPPEQAEFLLAQVKPLRNELNDSDLRVVTTTVNAAGPKSSDQNARHLTAVAASPWNRLAKLFGADHHVQAR